MDLQETMLLISFVGVIAQALIIVALLYRVKVLEKIISTIRAPEQIFEDIIKRKLPFLNPERQDDTPKGKNPLTG